MDATTIPYATKRCDELGIPTPALQSPWFSVAVVRPVGYIDMTNTSRLKGCLSDLYTAGHRRVVVDCEKVEYMSSIGWSTIAQARGGFRYPDGGIKICKLNKNLIGALRQLNYHRILEIHQHVPDCLAAFRTELMRSLMEIETETKNPEIEKFRNNNPSPQPPAAVIPLQERLTRMLTYYGPIGTREIRELLTREEFGGLKIGPWALRRVLKQMGLETRDKRIRFYVSR